MPVSSVSREVALILEGVEAAAHRDLHVCATPEERATLGLRTRELAGSLAMAADREESLLQNRTLGLGLAEPLSEPALDELFAFYAGGPPGFAINLCPFASPPGIERLLERRGMRTFFHHLKWCRGPEAPPEARTDLRIEKVGAERAEAWSAVDARAHDSTPARAALSARSVGREGWSHYLALDGEEPVAVGALYVRDGAAWLGSGATLEEHRRRGAQSALFARRIRDALEQGARWLTAETGPAWPDLPGESLRNAVRAGFYPAYRRPSWIWPVPE